MTEKKRKKSKSKFADHELVALIDARKATGLNYKDGELSERRINLTERYLGKKYGDEVPGQSQVVTRQCLEAVEWTLPSLLRVFLSAQTIAEFEPTGPEDEQAAKEETIAVNKDLRRDDGYLKLYLLLKDILMNPNCYMKVYWDEKRKVKFETYTDLTPLQAMELLKDPQVTPLEQDVEERAFLAPTGIVHQVSVYTIKVRRVETTGVVKFEHVLPEKLTIDSKLTSISLDDADFINHNEQVTRSELILQGFDPDIVKDLNAYTEVESETIQRRDATRGSSVDDDQVVNDEATELVDIDMTYLYLDYDGDGIAEYRRVIKSGTTILENEEYPENPFVPGTSVPMPHEHVGESWMELVVDLQDVYTTIIRQMLNNAYKTNDPRKIIGPGAKMSDVLAQSSRHPIRTKNMDHVGVEPVQPMIGSIRAIIQTLDELKETRTGVSKTTMGLDADSLSRVAQGALFSSLEQANQRIEALARFIAECTLKKIMLKAHAIRKRHQDVAYNLKHAGNWMSLNPQQWRDREDMVVTVGLGTGNKQVELAILKDIVGYQKHLMETGKGRLVTEQHAYNTADKMIEIAGLVNTEKYVADPAKLPPPQPPPPDPNIEIQKSVVAAEDRKNLMQNQVKHRELDEKEKDRRQKALQFVVEMKQKIKDEKRDFSLKEKQMYMDALEVLLKSEIEESRISQTPQEVDAAQANFRGMINV